MRLSLIPLRLFTLVMLLAVASSCTAHPAATRGASVDDSLWRAKRAEALRLGIDKMPIGEAVVASGKLFLGAPYVAGTLDRDSTRESLVVDLTEFDCVTFYENSLALARTLALNPKASLEDFKDQLRLLRYRGGKLRDYASRLHYSTDYFYDAATKGVLQPVTEIVGGSYAKKETREINFMTAHRGSYRQLNQPYSDSLFDKIQQVEREMKARGGYLFIPKQDIAEIEGGIQTGDILGITTRLNGLDCSHTGIAIRMPDGHIHFMHASSARHEVIISEETLSDYLGHSNSQTGIIVNRPLPVKQTTTH
jgi:hypothetical protein